MSEVQFPAVDVHPVEVAGVQVPSVKAIYNPETLHVYDITSQKYKLVKHEQMLDTVESVLDVNPKWGQYTRNVRIFHEGARMHTTYRFPQELAVQVKGKGDLVNPTLEVFNSYDRSTKNVAMLGAWRLICSNGLMVGEKYALHKKRHMPDLYLEDVEEVLKVGMTAIEQQAIQWQDWVERPLEIEDYNRVIKPMGLNKKETTLLEEEHETSTGWSLSRWNYLLEMPGDKYAKEAAMLTFWIFFNILTQFVTHRIQSHNRRLQLEHRLRQVLYS